MMKKSAWFVALSLVAMIMTVGCSSSDDGPSYDEQVQKFVGKWELPFYETPGKTNGEDALDVLFNADGTLLWYKHGSDTSSASGTFTVEDDVLTCVWQHSYVDLHGTCEAKLIDANTMDYLVYENLASGIKTNHFRGPRIY